MGGRLSPFDLVEFCFSHGCKPSLPVAEGAAGNPSCRTSGRILYFRYSSQGCRWMTVYGYARVSTNLALVSPLTTPSR